MSKDLDQTQATGEAITETSHEHACIAELITFAIVGMVKYKKEFGLTAFHPMHADIIDRACEILGFEKYSEIFDDSHPKRFAGDRTDEDAGKDIA